MIPEKSLNRHTFTLVAGTVVLLLTSCGTQFDSRNKMLVSVSDQRMVLVRDGVPVKSYPISTSKFGLGDQPGSKRTPLGTMQVAKKIGEGAPSGAVFKSRRPTGEILRPNAPGRDPIVSRILWLSGTEEGNRNTYRRFIYIHGTPEEWRVGSPASYGCIRMSSRDVIDLYKRVGVGAEVKVIRDSLVTAPELVETYAKRAGPGPTPAARTASSAGPAISRAIPVPEPAASVATGSTVRVTSPTHLGAGG